MKSNELRCLEQLVKPLILKQMWCDESYAAVARYGSKEWYKCNIGKKGFVVLRFVCKCCSGTRCSWLRWLCELALPVIAQHRQLQGVCQGEALEGIGQCGLVLQAPVEVVGRATVCSSHSSGGLSAVKGKGVAVFPFGIRSNKLVGLGKLKSLPYRKIFIILMWIAYDSKPTFIKASEPIFQVWNFCF